MSGERWIVNQGRLPLLESGTWSGGSYTSLQSPRYFSLKSLKSVIRREHFKERPLSKYYSDLEGPRYIRS